MFDRCLMSRWRRIDDDTFSSIVVMRLFGLVAINKIPVEPVSHLAHSWDDVMGV